MLASPSIAEKTAPSCKGFPIVGECFKFRGRMAMYNGGHTFWIWRVGTTHKYWVENDLPNGAEAKLDWDHFYWGNFEACPTTTFKKGYAQGICVTSIDKLTKSDRTN